jgi:ribose transport system substrate-binding protein
MNKNYHRRWHTQAGGILFAALAISACATASTSSKPPASTTGPSTQQSASAVQAPPAAPAEQLAKKVASAMGPKTTLPMEKIGILQIAGDTESALDEQLAIQAAAKAIGWPAVVCDAGGDPVKTATCGLSLLAEKVNAIVSISNEPSEWVTALQEAKARGIPVINVAGDVGPSPAIIGSYAPNDSKQGSILAAYVMKRLSGLPGTRDIAVETFPATWGAVRTAAITAAVKQNPGVKVAATAATDPTNVQQGTVQTVTNQLTENPSLKAIWFSYDVAGDSGAQAVAQKYPGKSFPDRPLVATFGTDSGTLALLRSGEIDATIENAILPDGWVAIDQLAEFFARHRAVTPGPTDGGFPEYEGFQIASYRIFTKANAPSSGPVPPVADYVAFFTTKWLAEFGR